MINLRSNYPSLDKESEMFARFVSHYLYKNKLLQSYLSLPNEQWFAMLSYFLNVPADVLNRKSRIEMCSSGNSAVFAVLLALRPVHSVIAVEAFTYSNCKAIAHLLGYQLFAIELDKEGMKPSSVKEAISKGAKLFYVQPTIQNPTCSVMSEGRRKEIANIISQSNAMLVEDDAYRFLHPNPPASFLELLPGKTIHIYSLSKPFNSFVKSCFIVLPKEAIVNLATVIDTTGSSLSSLSFLLTEHLLCLDAFKELIVQKQKRAEQVQNIIQPIISGLWYHTFSTSFHIWISLPQSINSKNLVEQLRQKQILITGGHECSVNDDAGFIRIALPGEKEEAVLQNAVNQIVQLLS